MLSERLGTLFTAKQAPILKTNKEIGHLYFSFSLHICLLDNANVQKEIADNFGTRPRQSNSNYSLLPVSTQGYRKLSSVSSENKGHNLRYD